MTEPATFKIADMLDHLTDAVRPQYENLADIAKARAMAGDAEFRRGLIAVNTAGLLLVMSLLKGDMHPITLKISAGLYFIGIISALCAWYNDLRHHKIIYNLVLHGPKFMIDLKTLPFSTQDIPNENAEQIGKIFIKQIERVSERMKGYGKLTVVFSYVAVFAFLLSSASLAIDFEISPIKSTTGPSAPEVVKTTDNPNKVANRPLLVNSVKR